MGQSTSKPAYLNAILVYHKDIINDIDNIKKPKHTLVIIL